MWAVSAPSSRPVSYTHLHRSVKLHKLHGQVQVSFYIGSIYDVDYSLWFGFQYELPGYDLFAAVGGKGVDPRQVGDLCLRMSFDGAALLVNGHSRKIAHMLV